MYIFQGVECLDTVLQKYNEFLVYGDPDIDGLYATKMTIDLLKSKGKSYAYYINSDRQHGFLLNIEHLKKFSGICIIAVDFAMTKAELQQIVSLGISIINIDHHEIVDDDAVLQYVQDSATGAIGIIINNQYSFEDATQQYLSGAGVCYNVYSCIDTAFDTTNHRAYVGITLLSDACVIENQYAQQFLQEAFTWDTEETHALINMVLSEKSKRYMVGTQKQMDREFLDYHFNPVLNALCRCNEQELALHAIMCPEEYTDFTQYKEIQKSIVQQLQADAVLTDLGRLLVCVIDVDAVYTGKINKGNFIGIIANHLLNEYNKTVLIMLVCNNMFVRGSVRGLIDGVNYLTIAQAVGIACEGHKAAFGVTALPANTEVYNTYAYKIAEAEIRYTETNTHTAIYLPVVNLAQQCLVDNKSAKYNMFVRASHRVYYDCSKCVWSVKRESQHAVYIEYLIDNVVVKCFTKGLTPENGVVLPLESNGYVKYTLETKLQ